MNAACEQVWNFEKMALLLLLVVVVMVPLQG
jgi:hypothetical protein